MRVFDPKIWFQVSGRFRLVAKLPDGKTGMQALAECGGQRCDDQKWIDGLGERHCGDYYLRCYAASEELTRKEWHTFKKSGGKTYF